MHNLALKICGWEGKVENFDMHMCMYMLEEHKGMRNGKNTPPFFFALHFLSFSNLNIRVYAFRTLLFCFTLFLMASIVSSSIITFIVQIFVISTYFKLSSDFYAMMVLVSFLSIWFCFHYSIYDYLYIYTNLSMCSAKLQFNRFQQVFVSSSLG